MKEVTSELDAAFRFCIINRDKQYWLSAKLYKSKLVIEDESGNKIAVHKRRKLLKIERQGNVDWLID